MENLQVKIVELTGGLNAVLNQLKTLDERTKNLEQKTVSSVENAGPSTSSPPLRAPTTEAELNEIGKLPDCVKDLQSFEGDPTQYVSWVHSVEGILKDYEIVRQKPIYRAIIQAIRRKCRGKADAALTSYNIFDDDWTTIKNCLSLHYADKRDVRTLEHQLTQLSQRGMSVDEFYATVNHQLSLIINKLKTESYSEETTTVLIETYRNRTLEVFIRGLNGELSKMLMLMKPKTLPEAYSQCIELRNTDYRTKISLHPTHAPNKIPVPVGLSVYPNPSKTHNYNTSFQRILPKTRYNPHVNPFVNRQFEPHRTMQQHGSQRPVNRPFEPQRQHGSHRPEPMDVDQSIQFRRSGSNVNRPWNNKRRAFSEQVRSGSAQRPIKQQRLFHTVQEQESNDDNISPTDEQINFLNPAYPAYHT